MPTYFYPWEVDVEIIDGERKAFLKPDHIRKAEYEKRNMKFVKAEILALREKIKE